MAFKSAIVVIAPDGNTGKHRASIKTSKLDLTVAVVEWMNFEQAVNVCQDIVQNQGFQSLIKCSPG